MERFSWQSAAVIALLLLTVSGCTIRDGLSGDAQGAGDVGAKTAGAANTHGREPVNSGPNEEYNASIVQILAHRDRYHGKEVQIKGYLLVRFEGTAIYLSKEDADYGMTRNGFWVSFDKCAVPYEGLAGPTQFDRKYVLIEGTFDKDNMGHMSAFQGTIENVNRVYELKKHD